MKNIICLLAAAALFAGCAKSDADRGSAGTTMEGSSSGSLTNDTNGAGLGTNGSTATPTPDRTQPTQYPRGN